MPWGADSSSSIAAPALSASTGSDKGKGEGKAGQVAGIALEGAASECMPSEAEAREALRIACCLDAFCDLQRFPQGWHTDVGVNGYEFRKRCYSGCFCLVHGRPVPRVHTK